MTKTRHPRDRDGAPRRPHAARNSPMALRAIPTTPDLAVPVGWEGAAFIKKFDIFLAWALWRE